MRRRLYALHTLTAGYNLLVDYLHSDTAPAVGRWLADRFRDMSAVEKARIVTELTASCRSLAASGIKMRHPSAGPDELHKRLFALVYGRELSMDVFGWDPVKEGF